MKRNLTISVFLTLVVCSLLFTKCNNDSRASGNGFSNGHKLKGRYINTDNGIRSFTFQEDGSFARGGAVSGEIRGGEYAAGSHESGTYNLSGKSLQLTYENGDTDDFTIEIFSYNDQNDYNQETPSRLKINSVMYVNVDE